MRRLVAILGILSLSGCMHVDPLSSRENAVSLWELNCQTPIRFTKHCFENRQSRLQVEIDGIDVRLSSTADGKIVFFQNTTYEYDFYWLTDPTSKTSARILRHIREELKVRHGVYLVEAIPILALRDVHGYIMVFDRPAFDYVSDLGQPSNKSLQPTAEAAD